jgi:hypothetical protein
MAKEKRRDIVEAGMTIEVEMMVSKMEKGMEMRMV